MGCGAWVTTSIATRVPEYGFANFERRFALLANLPLLIRIPA